MHQLQGAHSSIFSMFFQMSQKEASNILQVPSRINLRGLGSSSGTTKEILYYWVPAAQRAVSIPSFPVAVSCCREVALTGYCREQRAVGKPVRFSIFLYYMQCSWVSCTLLYVVNNSSEFHR